MLLYDFHWTVFLAVIPAYYYQLFLHELSHAFVARTLGYKNVKFWVWPWPRKVAGHWMMAGFSFEFESRHPEESNMWIAPMITASVWTVFVSMLSVVTFVWAFPFAVVALIDVLWFWKGYFWGPAAHDGRQYREARKRARG